MTSELSRNKFGRRFFSLLFGLVVLAVVLCAFGFAQVGRYVSSPTDEPVKADLIVALGGDAGARIVKARELYANGFAHRVLLTGMENSVDETRHAYLNWRAAFLVESGVPREDILYDAQSRNTWEEAVNTRRLLAANGWQSVLVVSDPPHMRRLSWVWGKVFDGSPLQYRLVAAPLPRWDPANWWLHEASAQFVLMELIKQGYYHAAY